ncbi:hypothetical protein [Hydrogenoanaerobacterium sp.]
MWQRGHWHYKSARSLWNESKSTWTKLHTLPKRHS